MVKYLSALLLLSSFSQAKDIFTQEHILKYLDDNNPFFYSQRADYYSTKTKVRIAQSAFDTNINAMYETKRYPITSSDYKEAGFKKNLYNGVELSLGYRDAQGIQEYNNIKTKDDGEVLASIKLPLINILNNTSENAIAFELAKLQTTTMQYQTQSKITQFYLNTSALYYQLLYYHDFLKLTKALLKKSETRFSYTQKEVAVGKVSQIALLDVKSQLISRKQAYFNVENTYNKTLNEFVRYLNISVKTFHETYVFPPLALLHTKLLDKQSYIKQAKQQRVELKKISFEEKKLQQRQKGNSVERFPKLDVKVSGVYDFYEQSKGYKVSANFLFPLQRGKYKGQKEFLQKESLRYQSLRAVLMNNIVTNITTLMQSIQTAIKNTELIKEEVNLRILLESAEERKLKEGLSNLIFMNQRETATLQSKQKLLLAYLEMHKLYLSLRYEIGMQLKIDNKE